MNLITVYNLEKYLEVTSAVVAIISKITYELVTLPSILMAAGCAFCKPCCRIYCQLCFIVDCLWAKQDFLLIEGRHRHAFCFCDLDLDPGDLDIRAWLTYYQGVLPKVNFLCEGFQRKSITHRKTDRQTDRHRDRCVWEHYHAAVAGSNRWWRRRRWWWRWWW